ncbi:hypothetical protein E4U53_003396 [Claviceps sorghi]|nr:hypothetical protein E4U53_003396 [Claviceps sorghi]
MSTWTSIPGPNGQISPYSPWTRQEINEPQNPMPPTPSQPKSTPRLRQHHGDSACPSPLTPNT